MKNKQVFIFVQVKHITGHVSEVAETVHRVIIDIIINILGTTISLLILIATTSQFAGIMD